MFFFSGAAGLLLETLWFRVAGLTLGNSLWASTVVLASFMAGLAVGNAIAARQRRLARGPLKLYAIAEGIVGVVGGAIVLVLPALSPTLGRLFSHALARPWLVNVLRLSVASGLMLVPATAMGLTLPLLSGALTRWDDNFGRVLGRLYGWNTIGAVAGALGGEMWLIGWLGLRGTAFVAGTLNLAIAAAALVLARRIDGGTGMRATPETSAARRPISARGWRLLGAAFLAGATLLVLEVVWFRFLQLFVYGTNLVFAAMLAVVLLGIGTGGVIASRWLGRVPRAHRATPVIALAAGVAIEICYGVFDPHVGGVVFTTADTWGAAWLLLRLMLPTSVLSGVLFTSLGAAQREECGEAAETAGKLALANTLGAMVGAPLAGFFLIPHLGVERTLFAAMMSYGLVAGLTAIGTEVTRRQRVALVVAGAIFIVGGGLYPFGLMKRHFVPLVLERYASTDPKLLEMREGLTETTMYLRDSFHGHPLHARLMTNGYSMSATTFRGRRYMSLYVYWSLAVNPGARKALLISYGIGNTARALTEARQLESIDVVDISRDILELGRLAFPDMPPPLSDPRVRAHVEDGRFFLQTTNESFDLITAEPPPLRGAGIANLYSTEYFRLVHDRLREGGVATYWLPVNQLWLSETKAVIRGFCEAFPDCTLWSGAGLQWMLAGTRGLRGPVPEEQFTAQWHDPPIASELAASGFEQPETLGATFLADAATLLERTEGTPPLDDDHPGRILDQYPPDENGDPSYRSWMDPGALRRSFEASPFIRDVWPAGLRLRTADFFAPQAALDDISAWGHFDRIQLLHAALTHSSLRTLPLLLMGTEPAVQRIAVPLYEAGARDVDLEFEMGARAMSERDYPAAIEHLARVTEGGRAVQAALLRTLAFELTGKPAEARRSLDAAAFKQAASPEVSSLRWLTKSLDRAERAAVSP